MRKTVGSNNGALCKTCSTKDCGLKSYTQKLENHELVSYSLIFVDSKCTLLYEKHYCGASIEQNFFETLALIEEPLLRQTCGFKDIKHMKPLSSKERADFEKATYCYMCKTKFDQNIRLRVKNKDHSHFNGKYQGAACTWCNLLNRSQRKIPLYFHNFKGYDSKIIVSCIKKSQDTKTKFNILSSNSQNFRSITYRSFRFCDSLEHMPMSLDKMVLELNKTYNVHNFKILQQSITIFGNNFSYQKMKLLCNSKGVYPYQLCDHHHKMIRIRTIPPKKLFYNNLLQKPCSRSEYNHAKKVWDTFSVKNLKEYTKLYNHCDVLLLAEAFFLYRKVILQSFNLDPSHFFGVPSLSYNIMLKFSKIKLSHLSDPKMNDWFRSSIRGGVAFVGQRYENGDPEYTGMGYQKFIKYLDATNLYGSMMLSKLPYKDFKFLTPLELKILKGKLCRKEYIEIDGSHSYFVEVDLNYPPHLHKTHGQYPLAPDKFEVTYEDLSLFSRMQLSYSDPIKFKNMKFSETKLLPHFYPRKITFVTSKI